MKNSKNCSIPIDCKISSSSEYHLRVYENRSELISQNGTVMEFKEGPNNEITKRRYKTIADALKIGYLRDQIHQCRENPMRSANKKHGNIADIELMGDGKIIESWDAKYGKSYLRDELEELNDKILEHDGVQEVGFVSSDAPKIDDEVKDRLLEIEELHGIRIHILSLDEWVKIQLNRAAGLASEEQIAKNWITAYTESLALKRPRQAPIDEPCYQWLLSLIKILYHPQS